MPHRSSVVSVLAGLLLFLLMGSAAGAATLTVTSTADSGAGSLRDAIATAAAGDTIIFAAGITTINLTTGQLSIDKNLTINGGSGVTVTRQAGSPNFRIFTIASGNTVILNGLTISNGNSGLGGGIANSGTLTVTNSTFSDNSADAGSGGGGIYNYGTLTVTNSTFSGNSAAAGHGGGGGISNSGTLTVTNSTFSGNSSSMAIDGGGIYNSGTLTVTNSTFSGNSSEMANGGGISNYGTLTVTNSTFSGNSAAAGGGGINNNNYSTLTVTNSTFSGNSADYGGGIFSYDSSTLTVSNSTFSGNSAAGGGGIYSYNSTVHLSNTILANSPSGGDCANSGGTFNASGVNLVMDGTCGSSFPSNTDPQLGPLANNGGPTQTMALLPGSPAIDAADNAICAAAPVNGRDQRGVTRPQGTQCDIGAYEFMLTPTTTTLNVDPTSPVYGQTVTLTATVSPTTATGTVSFQDGSTPLICMGGNQTLNGGTATCSLNSFPVGTYSDLTAIYGGDSTHAASQGTTSLTVNQANTTTTITSDNPDPSAVNGVVTVSYGVAVTAPGAGTPTGTVTVSDGVDSCVGSVAAGTCAITLHTVGSRTLTASYAGDGHFAGSTSAGVAHSVLATTAQGDAGGGPVTVAITDGTCIGFANGSTNFTAAPTPLPAGVTFPYGVFGFTAICPSDGTGTLTLTLSYPNPLPQETRYWKYGPTADNHTSHWYVLRSATLNGNTAIITITDGGLGDDDLVADGNIEDQGGPGIGPGATGIPTLSEWALLLLMGLLGLVLGITVRRRAPPDRPV